MLGPGDQPLRQRFCRASLLYRPLQPELTPRRQQESEAEPHLRSLCLCLQILPLSPATTYTLNYTRPAAEDSKPEVTALAVSLNGTNTTLFELPANGTSFQARQGDYLFDGVPHSAWQPSLIGPVSAACRAKAMCVLGWNCLARTSPTSCSVSRRRS